MKVAYLTPSATLGGAERSLLDAIASLREALPRFEPTLIVGEEGPLTARARAEDARVVVVPFPDSLAGVGDSALRGGTARTRMGWARRLPKAALGSVHYARGLRRALRALAPDLVHSNTLKSHALTPFLGRRAPVIWHLRDYLGARPLVGHLLAPASRFAAAGVGISRSLAEDARRVLPRLDVEVVYNAIDVATFTPVGHAVDLDALAGVEPAPPGTVRIGLVATYGRWKGQDLFLEALAQVPANLAWRAYIVGGPIYRTAGSQWSREELEERAARFGLSERLAFVGFHPHPEQVFRALDVVVHASTRPEPFGRTIVEAMACARAVVATRAGGAAELFRPNTDALGVPPRDPTALARALRRLIAAPDLRAALGASGRARVEERFARERLGTDLARLYTRIRQ